MKRPQPFFLVVFCLLSALPTACSNTGFRTQTIKTQLPAAPAMPQPGPKDSGDEQAINKPETLPPDPPILVIDPIPAALPVSVAGATLTCMVTTPLMIACEIHKDKTLVDLDPKKSFLIASNGASWLKIDMFHVSLGRYESRLPEAVNSSYEIAFLYNEKDYLTATIKNPKSDFVNLIGGGDFEDLSANSAETFEYFRNDYLIQKKSKWSISLAQVTACPPAFAIAILELQSGQKDNPSRTGFSGHFVELDGTCPDSPNGEGGNIALSQSFASQANHLYRVEYFYKKRTMTNPFKSPTSQHHFVQIDATVAIVQPVTEAVWLANRFTFMGTGSIMTLKFEEDGDPDRMGSLIDDIVLVDLGQQ